MQQSFTDNDRENQVHRYCTFRLAGRLYGFDIRDVKEINTEVRCTPIYHASKEIKGYINIRGQIYLLLDLRMIFGFKPKNSVDEQTRVLLFMPHVGDLCGVLVDSIEDVVTVDDRYLENRRQSEREVPEGLERRSADIGIGVCKLEDELLIILSAGKLIRVVTHLQTIKKTA